MMLLRLIPKQRFVLLTCSLVLPFTSPVLMVATAQTILFEDNFNSENGGTPTLNFSDLTNWDVTDGSVDLIGNGLFDFFPAHRLYLDLDGTTFNAATIESKTTFTLDPGVYTLQFGLAGSQRGDENTVTVTLENVYQESFTLGSSEPFRTIIRDRYVSTATSAKLIFDHEGEDNIGLLLDNVRLIAGDMVPPVCRLLERSENRILVEIQDSGSGLMNPATTWRFGGENVDLFFETPFDPFFPRRPVVISAVKIDASKPSLVAFTVPDAAGNVTTCDPVLTTLLAEVPEQFELEQNYPNPFNPSTTIRFQVAEQSHVTLEIYDVMGSKVATLVNEEMAPGTYAAEWDGRNSAGVPVAGGAYVYHIQAGTFTETKIMTLLK